MGFAIAQKWEKVLFCFKVFFLVSQSWFLGLVKACCKRAEGSNLEVVNDPSGQSQSPATVENLFAFPWVLKAEKDG